MSTPDWAEAACRGVDGDIFFPTEKNGSPKQAKMVCAGCPIVLACQQYAITHQLEGVWGMTTSRERASIRRKADRERLKARKVSF